MNAVVQTFNNITYSRENLSDGRIKLSIEIANERFNLAKEKVFQRLSSTVSIPGFRPGKAPKNVLEANLGPKLFEETLGEVVPEVTSEVLKREKVTPIDQVAYQVEKVADGSGAKFNATFTPFPQFKLPKLSSIKATKGKATITDEDVDKVVDQMFTDRKDKKMKKDDKWTASLGMKVKTLKELKVKVREELQKQKESLEQNKYIDSIVKQIVDQCKFEVPNQLVEREVNSQEQQYKVRIERLGMKVEDFLKSQKTTLDELKKGWRNEAKERVKVEIVLLQFAKNNNIQVTEADIDAQIMMVKDEKLKEQYGNPQARNYLRSIILRQKIVQRILQEVEGKKVKKS
jgi:FKBP-type peptidyl-prolyl cis-trans isomerase (trigger factor)